MRKPQIVVIEAKLFSSSLTLISIFVKWRGDFSFQRPLGSFKKLILLEFHVLFQRGLKICHHYASLWSIKSVKGQVIIVQPTIKSKVVLWWLVERKQNVKIDFCHWKYSSKFLLYSMSLNSNPYQATKTMPALYAKTDNNRENLVERNRKCHSRLKVNNRTNI